MLTFTSFGHQVRARFWDDPHIEVDLHGRTILLTGANSGIGLAASKALAQRGARIIMVCRSAERGEQARREIAAVATGPEPRLELCDVSDLDSVARLCERLRDEKRLDALINNAGVLLDERETSAQGHEQTFATNVLGGHLLVRRLQGLLAATPGARVINVTSGGMYTQKLDVDDLQAERRDYDGVKQYAQTKRAQVILSEIWAERLLHDGVVVHAMHPGWASTPGVMKSLPKFNKLLGPALRSAEQGADTLVWLAAKDEALESSGKLWFDRKPRRTHLLPGTRSSEADRRKLFEICQRLTEPQASVSRTVSATP